MLYQEGPHSGSNMGQRMHSYPIYQEFQKRAEPLSRGAGTTARSRRRSASTTRPSGSQAEMVSGNYFSVLGVTPAAGRVFSSQEDDQIYQGHPVVVLSHDYWVQPLRRRSGGGRQEDPRQRLPDDDCRACRPKASRASIPTRRRSCACPS